MLTEKNINAPLDLGVRTTSGEVKVLSLSKEIIDFNSKNLAKIGNVELIGDSSISWKYEPDVRVHAINTIAPIRVSMRTQTIQSTENIGVGGGESYPYYTIEIRENTGIGRTFVSIKIKVLGTFWARMPNNILKFTCDDLKIFDATLHETIVAPVVAYDKDNSPHSGALHFNSNSEHLIIVSNNESFFNFREIYSSFTCPDFRFSNVFDKPSEENWDVGSKI